MTNISRDISSKLELGQVEVLVDIARLTKELGFPFFVLGATARDIVVGAIFGVQTTRATLDIDFAIRVSSWDEYQALRDRMIASGRYTPDKKQRQRLLHDNGTILDLVPFGSLEDPIGSVSWPPEQDVVMRTIGFEEALQSSIDVLISRNPDVTVKVSSPAALAVMKILSWDDKYPIRTRDAEDLMFLMKTYIELGNESRIWDEDKDMMAEGNFDYIQASSRLLGRDMRKIMSESTHRAVRSILAQETDTSSSLRLVTDIARARLGDAEEILSLLRALNRGITEADTDNQTSPEESN